ncbi:DUF2971 domain-containing protein [Holdemanella biformis]|uniref:DUF2971 domain-containing protein n=1 Tax=Holdemanella biformis TaxID=1735 RepID=A0A395W958_9FIRM|nr:DUF2971 domain-containing protein [Holdemanella biformis]RGU71151.1 DUF2971 domain-containing protein [Holdemanella biformis]RGU90779.1 DUF2971 domain-containing protein [Holdemanella biformis]
MNELKYLYHYTNIETLALILKNRTIRFNSLDKMDDLQEQQTADINNIGQFCYISSWTDDSAESIPMWNMYASLNQGVRIKLRKNPFKTYKNYAKDLEKFQFNATSESDDSLPVYTNIPFVEMFDKGFYSAQIMKDDLLYKVEYTSDKNKLYPHILNDNADSFTLEIGLIGKYKNIHWKFQNEWRYILNIIPLNLNQPVAKSIQDFQLIANKMRLGLEKQPFPYYDMTISDEAFNEMEITLSPAISNGNRVIVENLIEKYNHSAKLEDSCLLGLI